MGKTDPTIERATDEQGGTCPTAEAWARSEVNLKREFKRLRRSVKVCALCEVVHGPCARTGVRSLRATIAQELAAVLAEIGQVV